MRDIRLIVSDLDGTLLSPDHSLSKHVAGTIRQYVKEGGLFTVATGRPYRTAMPVIQELGIDIPVILSNGAVLAEGGRVLERYCLSVKNIADMLLDFHLMGLSVLLFREHEIQTFARTEEIEAYEHKERVSCSVISARSSRWTAGELEKVILIGNLLAFNRVWDRWVSVHRHAVSPFQSEADYVELVSGQVSKGFMLQRLSSTLGIEAGRIMAIGNQMNDLSMLQLAGIGVSVANSPIELQMASDYVSQASYGEGVIEAINRFVHGGKGIWKYGDWPIEDIR